MKRYRVHNWRQYNQSLISRGSLEFWIDNRSLKLWRAARLKGRTGHPRIYSDEAVILLLTLKTVFHLSYRSLQGFVSSLFVRQNLALPIPSYTQTCRRAQSIKLPRWMSLRRPRAIIIDSTGLKIYGEGEWQAKKHGLSRRRTWRKLHIALCAQTQEVIAVELTDAGVSDDAVLPRLLERSPRSIKQVIADGAYDTRQCHQAIHDAGANPLIPPRKTAVYEEDPDPSWCARNHAVLEIAGLGGDTIAQRIWKKGRGYHIRSLVETAMYRYKRLIGPQLYSRRADSQRSEVTIKSLVLNKMNQIGMPDSSWT